MASKLTNSLSGRRIGTVAGLIVGLLGAAGVALATPASAGVNCDPGFHCLFFTTVSSAKHQFFNSDPDFSNDRFSGGNGLGAGQIVDNNSEAASNSSTGGFESHYYDGRNFSGFLFCVNPGDTLRTMPAQFKNRASSLQLRGRTTIHCLSN